MADNNTNKDIHTHIRIRMSYVRVYVYTLLYECAGADEQMVHVRFVLVLSFSHGTLYCYYFAVDRAVFCSLV